LQRLPHVNQLNSPWAMVVAPATDWGNFSGKLLVGQFGSGAIIAYDLSTNTLEGVLQDDAGLPLRLNGLWGLGFGNGAKSGSKTTLYFAAGYFVRHHHGREQCPGPYATRNQVAQTNLFTSRSRRFSPRPFC